MRQATRTMRSAAVLLAAALALAAVFAFVPASAWADDAAAEIEETAYATLQEAIDAAEDDAVITLSQDLTLTEQLVLVEKTLTIDLNGYTLTISGENPEAGIVVSGGAVVIQNGTIDDVRVAQEETSGLVTLQVIGTANVTTYDLVVLASAPADDDATNVILQVGTDEELDDLADVPTVTLGSGTALMDVSLVEESDEVADEAADEAAEETGLVVGVLVVGANFEAVEESEESEDAEEAYAGTTLIVADGALIEVTGNAVESSTDAWITTIVVEDGATIISTSGYGIYQPGCGSVTILGGTISGVCALYEGVAADEADASDEATGEDDEAVEEIEVGAAASEESEEAEAEADDAEADAEAEADDESSGTTLVILGGTFISTSDELAAVCSENCEGFIVAGSFSSEIDESYVYETSSVEESDAEEVVCEIAAAVQAEGYTGTYDGSAHTGSVSFSSYADDLETAVVYSEDGVTFDLTEAPSYTNVGSYTVYYQATYGDYTAEGSFTVEISPATLTVTYAGETVAYGTEPELAVTIEGFVNGESATSDAAFVSPTVSAEGCESEGSYELAPSGGEATNYEFVYVAGTLTVTHNLYYVEEVASTCAAAGTAAHYACTGCSTLFSDSEGTTTVEAADLSLAAVSHTYDDGVVTTEATCEEAGTFTYTCTVCGATIEESIAALGHDYEAVWTWSDDLSSATLTLTCANDSSHFVFIDSIVATSAVTTAATAEADGVITYTAQATYAGVGYTDTQTATYEYAEDESLATASEDEEEAEEADESVSESSELSAGSSTETVSTADEADEESGDTALSASGDDMSSVIVIVIAIAIIAIAIVLIAFVVRRRNSH